MIPPPSGLKVQLGTQRDITTQKTNFGRFVYVNAVSSDPFATVATPSWNSALNVRVNTVASPGCQRPRLPFI